MLPLSMEVLCHMVFMKVSKKECLKQINTKLHVLLSPVRNGEDARGPFL